jgi:hypothetical protein
MKEPLGSKVALIEALENPSLFRIEFTNDVRAKEMRWVIFTGKLGFCFLLVVKVQWNSYSISLCYF